MAAAAQEIRMGGLDSGLQVMTSAEGTLIDWSRPANAVGTVNTATVAWTGVSESCGPIFYVRFYAIPGNGLAAVMIAERGPFAATNGLNTVTLDPPVSVTPETYLAVRRVAGSEGCGQAYGTITRTPARAIFAAPSFTGGQLTGASPLANFTLQAQASNTPWVRVSTLPVVGSVAGAFGSQFRTSLSMINPSDRAAFLRLVFHPSGRTGVDTDPSLDVNIPAYGTNTNFDIVSSMGQSGLGSIDILTRASVTPIVSARVFNDTFGQGTSGFSEEAIPAASTYYNAANVFIPKSSDFRLNIGIRTFTGGDVTVRIYDEQGTLTSQLTKNYPPNYFEQVSAAAFVNGANLPPGGHILVTAIQKDFIVYGATTDNLTNDPSMRVGLD
ncbi:MAG: hypothetical protein JOZ54_24065 [Acidobacteria bacterium]|nr:hypothetical protein [Acidobacteriota bacterium]